jgi:hypothetical protein
VVETNLTPPPGVTPNRRTYNIIEFIEPHVFFGWARVDSATQFNYDKHGNVVSVQEFTLIENNIQIAKYDAKSEEWEVDRYYIPNVSFRKYQKFELFELPSNPINPGEVQSVRLQNGNIGVTIFMREDNKPVAYQILFDSLGNYIAPDKMVVLKPENIHEIPDGSKMYIKREPAGRDKSGKIKNAYVYIWGYNDEGVLYWKKYHVD